MRRRATSASCGWPDCWRCRGPGFYAWLGRAPSARALRTERIEAKIGWYHGESDEVSGAPRILVDLREDGEIISRETVAKSMRRLELKGICPRRWRTTPVVDHDDAYPADAVARTWDTGVLKRVWIGDIERHEVLSNEWVWETFTRRPCVRLVQQPQLSGKCLLRPDGATVDVGRYQQRPQGRVPVDAAGGGGPSSVVGQTVEADLHRVVEAGEMRARAGVVVVALETDADNAHGGVRDALFGQPFPHL